MWMVGGEFSPNVGKSPNHNTNSFSIVDAGLQLRLGVGREGGRDLAVS
jgi:hypothetical protein